MNEPEKLVENRQRDSNGRFMPGISGNAAGRPPKESCFKDILDKVIEEIPTGSQKTHFEIVARKMVELATAGDMSAIREVMDRALGKPGIWADLHLSNDPPEHVQMILESFRNIREGYQDENSGSD